MSDSDSYGNAGMVDDVFASSTSSLKTTILVALAECLLHRPFKPGENDLVSCMKCTGPNTFYNLYCSLIKRESRFARTNDVWDALQTSPKFKYLVHGFRKALRNVRKMQRVDADMFGGLATHSARLATLRYKDISCDEVLELFESLKSSVPIRIFSKFNGSRSLEELASQTVAYIKKARVVWSYCKYVIPNSWVARRQREIHCGKRFRISPSSSAPSSRVCSPVSFDEAIIKPDTEAGEITLERMREVLLRGKTLESLTGLRPIFRLSQAPKPAPTPPTEPVLLGKHVEPPPYGVVDEVSRMGIRSRNVKRKRDMSNIEFGKDSTTARESCIFLATHISNQRNKAFSNNERYYSGEPCLVWEERHPRLPCYNVRLTENDACVACTNIALPKGIHCKTERNDSVERQAYIPEACLYGPSKKRSRRRISYQYEEEDSEAPDTFCQLPPPVNLNKACAAYQAEMSDGQTLFLAVNEDGTIGVK